jgi:hypothetical protein
MQRDHRGLPPLPPTPLGWKLWFAFCGVLGLGFMAVVVWAIIRLVGWVTSQ